MKRAVICGIGAGIPAQVLTNQDLEKMVETSDEWITQRTGIKERRLAGPEDSASTLSIVAAKEALLQSGLSPAELDMVIVGTVSGDYAFPSTACIIQDALGAKNAGAFDVGAACAGFIYSLATGSSLIQSGMVRNALVVGVDTLTKWVDWADRSTCVLFGDGAGAVVLKGEENTDRGILSNVLMSDGEGGRHILLEVGGSKYPYGAPQSEGKRSKVFMEGAATYRFAVNAMGDACTRALAQAGMQASDIDIFVPHQANLRIISAAAERLGLPDEKVFVNVDRYGNTSAGSIPIGLYEACNSGRLKPGMVVMTVGFGAGLVWGANIIRW